MNVTKVETEDTECPKREDGEHCEHWWDGETCCACHAPALTDEQKRKAGLQ